MPVETGKEKFFSRLETLITEANRLKVRGFDEQEPEAATCHELILPLLDALGFHPQDIKPEFKIIGDSVDYLLKSDRPLIFLEAKSLLDKAEDLFSAHREQVQRYLRNYRVSPEQVEMAHPVTWIVLTNFAQFHFIRVTEDKPSFSFTLDDLWKRREEFWDLLALENLEAGRIEEIWDEHQKAGLDQRFLADLKRWRLMLANGFALRNQKRPLDEIVHASQQLLNRFLMCRMLETNWLIEHNKLARAYSHYEVFHGDFTEKTFAESLRESLFQEIKFKFNTELFEQPLLCDTLALDNNILAMLVGHEPLSAEVAATCGFESGQGELLAFRHLYRYDFSRMSSDVMGAVYEKFLAHKLFEKGGRIVIEDSDELRKKEGIYFTPRYIVDYIVVHTLGEKIKPVLAEAKALLGYKNFKGANDKIRELKEIKVLDPAMGSGSFLLGAFDALIAAYGDYNAECDRCKREKNGGGTLFDAPNEIAQSVPDAAFHVLTENLHGVDLDAQALDVAKLNFWIRYMKVERDAMRERIRFEKGRKQALELLPNLTRNFKRGNSLIADPKVAGDAAFNWAKEFPEIMGGKTLGGTGGSPVSVGNLGGTGNLPVSVGNLPTGTKETIASPGAIYSKRNLPHFEKPWAIYHVIIHTIAPRKLSAAARDIVFDCILHWRGSRYRLVAACVMPDHAHFIIQPGVKEADKEGNPFFWPLSEILHSIKSYSAKEVNKLDKARGALWQEERYDRYLRSDLDLQEKFHYVCRNPWAAGLVQESEPWPWLWTPEIETWKPYIPLNKRTGSTGDTGMGGTGDSPVPVGDPPTGKTVRQVAGQHGQVARATQTSRGFDVVIGNPPYERIQVMQANAPEAAEFLKANYRAAASGNFDIYVCFIERGLQLLNTSGVFGYINFFNRNTARPCVVC